MSYLKMFIKYCILIPIALVYDAIKWCIETSIPFLVMADEFLEDQFSVAVEWVDKKENP